jgi:hypothetical protein
VMQNMATIRRKVLVQGDTEQRFEAGFKEAVTLGPKYHSPSNN